jgi:uncharacterized protein
MARLPPEIKPAMQGAVPSILVTCSPSGVPNVTIISQVYWVDEERVALSFQFFSKTIKNVRENPRASVWLVSPIDLTAWVLDIRYLHSETEGPTFDQMDMQLEAIASMSGMSDVFKLKAADIYAVESVQKIDANGPMP